MAVFALPPLDGSFTEPVVFYGTCMYQRNVEPAGDIYELYLLRRLGLIEESESDEAENKEEDAEEAERVDKEKLNEKRKKGNKAEALKNLVFKNHYHAMGLETLYFEATLEDVRKAYKKKVLTHHPDKFEEEGGYDEVAKQQWLAVSCFNSDSSCL